MSMKIYKTQKEVEADIKDGVLTIEDNVTFECDIDIRAEITARNIDAGDIKAWNIKAWNIKARDIDAGDIDAGDIDAWNIKARDIDARNIDAGDIKAGDIDAGDIKAGDISYYAFCNVYESITCTSWEARRENAHDPICLDGELTVKDKEVEEVTMEEVCKKFGREVKIRK